MMDLLRVLFTIWFVLIPWLAVVTALFLVGLLIAGAPLWLFVWWVLTPP